MLQFLVVVHSTNNKKVEILKACVAFKIYKKNSVRGKWEVEKWKITE